MKRTATIATGDTIFASIIKCGLAIGSLRLSGFNTVEEIIRHLIHKLATEAKGLITIELRCADGGWCQRRQLRLV